MIKEFIQHSLGWGIKLGEMEGYAFHNFVVLLLALYGCVSILINIFRWINKLK